jgi:hypothetical protein
MRGFLATYLFPGNHYAQPVGLDLSVTEINSHWGKLAPSFKHGARDKQLTEPQELSLPNRNLTYALLNAIFTHSMVHQTYTSVSNVNTVGFHL